MDDRKVIYYSDELNDEFSIAQIEPRKIDESYVFECLAVSLLNIRMEKSNGINIMSGMRDKEAGRRCFLGLPGMRHERYHLEILSGMRSKEAGY